MSIPCGEYESHLREAARELGKNIEISGFRKGRAPYEVVRSHVGDMRLLSEASSRIMSTTYIRAIKEHNFMVAMPPKVTIVKAAPGNAFEYTAEVIVLPTATLPELSTITVNKKKIEIQDADVQELIEELRRMRAHEERKADGAELMDKIECDIQTYIVRKNQKGEEGKAQSIILGITQMVTGFEKEMIGVKKGDKKTFTVHFPQGYYKSEYADEDVEITVEIHDVWKVTLPDVNDAFAHNVNKEFTTVEKLKEDLKNNLERKARFTEMEGIEEEMITALILKTDFCDIAEELKKYVQQQLLDEIKFTVSEQKVEWTEYLRRLKKTEEELNTDLKEAAIRRIKRDAIIMQVIARNALKVSRTEIEEEANKFLRYFASVKQAHGNITMDELVQTVEGRLLNRKAIEWLRSTITIKTINI